tara:strand:+ start:211 stop:1179 length:969 start_codon:yes stop_codon:yes gene_type:complete
MEYNDIFEDIIGHNLIKSILISTLEKKQISPAYLFNGPNGVGRKLTAIRFLEGLLIKSNLVKNNRRRLQEQNHPDLIWIEPSYLIQGKIIPRSSMNEQKSRSLPQIRIEQIKDLSRFLSRKPLEANISMAIVEDVEDMNESSANALLKTLEEPSNGILILISSRPEKLLPTIKSRCQNISFSALNKHELDQVLVKINAKEKWQISDIITEDDLLDISHGSPGEWINNVEYLEEIPRDILIRIQKKHDNPIDSLNLARDISESLNIDSQIWLIKWLQEKHWRINYDLKVVNILERLRQNLKFHVQSRLAWEMALLKIGEQIKR